MNDVPNRPGDYVHHVKHSFGWLIAPWFRGQWFMWARNYGFCLASPFFHNCTRTGQF